MTNKNRYIRTDLATECRDTNINNIDEYGIRYKKEERGCVLSEKIRIETEEGSKIIGKPIGTYITVSFGKIWLLSDEDRELVICEIARQIRSLAEARSLIDVPVLVCGLGNRSITPDSLGPKVIDEITVTRHISHRAPEIFQGLRHCEVSAFAPGVLGQTGIETLELIRGAKENASPGLVIVIDALAARSTERLASTIQLTDTGISPGSGIGNCRAEINEKALGVPVIAIGVPTVVDSSTLVYDVLEKAGIDDPDGPIRDILENGQSFFVSLKESDIAVSELTHIISRAINKALSKESV
ncbi:MAG: GPR endopeptidase [Ruminococcaceae bacterium]|nr:GPR endopeptidase [Oscillospiraceae bacterium]